MIRNLNEFKKTKEISEIYTFPLDVIEEIPSEMPKLTKSFEERIAESAKLPMPESHEEMLAYHTRGWLDSSKEFYLKEVYNNLGMFAFVSWKWVAPFVEWINGRKVLEVMAGRGWLSYALRQKGVDVIATDDYSWSNKKGWKEPLTHVDEVDAIESVNLLGDKVDIVIMAWPYMNTTAYQTIKELHKVNPHALVVYIGEGCGGCTADDRFHDHFKPVDDKEFWEDVAPNYQSWNMIHDRLELGRYNGR